jgi:hypothetical protein
MSKYVSEQVWRNALDEVFGWIIDADRRGYAQRDREKLKHRFQRIYLAGEVDWQEKYDAS